MSKNSTNSFISLIVGLIIGGILGVLFALIRETILGID